MVGYRFFFLCCLSDICLVYKNIIYFVGVIVLNYFLFGGINDVVVWGFWVLLGLIN